MQQFSVVEKFVSIDGEGTHAGGLAVFIRFQGCNLQCDFCDTQWANAADVPYECLDTEDLVAYVQSTGVQSVTLTGGEPLLQTGIAELITALGALGYRVEVETNGSVFLEPFADMAFRPIFTMDYKLPGSGMESAMCTANMQFLRRQDAVKFVVNDRKDLTRAIEVVHEYALTSKCTVFFSPVYGSMEPSEIVDFMKNNRLDNVRLQLQLHKYIWDPHRRGV